MALRFAGAGALVLCLLLSACGGGSSSASSSRGLVGTILGDSKPVSDFTLTDQDGVPFRMADARGKVVLLTFLYTHCTDTCPFLAMKIKLAAQLLGSDAGKVVFVAVTTDPARDTRDVTAAYTKAAGLEGTWRFLTGSREEVRAVWAGYGISVQVEEAPAPAAGGTAAPSHESEDPSQGLDVAALRTAGEIIAAFGSGYEVGHTSPYFLIDRRGTIRVLMDALALPADIAANLRRLM